jgi:hypothetical protein
MQLASEDDESTRLSCPPGSLLMPHVIEVPLTLLFIEHVESKVKKLGPDRGGENQEGAILTLQAPQEDNKG